MNSEMSPACWYLSILLSLAPLAVFAHSAVEPVPRDDQSWRDKQEALNQRVREAGRQAQVIFIGDSITQHWDTEGAEVWARYYAPRKALNLGISGDETQHVLWRLENGNLAGLQPKVAVVLVGTNNVDDEAIRVAQVADGVRAIVEQLRERLPGTRVLLVALLPRNENPGPLRGNVLQINQIIRRLADDREVFWVDFGYRFLRSDGTLPRELMRDYLHPTAQGYQIWAEAMEDQLCALLGDTHVAPPRSRE